MNGHVQLREFIEEVIRLRELRRDDQFAAEKERLKEKFEALAQALELQAAAYPTVKDFNELKSHVDVELASRSGSSNAVTTVFQVLTLMSLGVGIVLAYLTYLK